MIKIFLQDSSNIKMLTFDKKLDDDGLSITTQASVSFSTPCVQGDRFETAVACPALK